MQRVCRRFLYPRGALLNKIAECKRVDQVKRVHARIVVAGLDQCSVVQAKLIRKLTELRVPTQTYAQPVFDRVTDPNPFLWTALIRGYALEGRLSVSAGIYLRMRSSRKTPLSFTFSALFKACGVVGDVDLGRALHGQTISLGGFESDLHVGNSLTAMYAKCGVMESARKLLDEMPERDSVSWTQMIVWCGKNGDMDTAEALFGESEERDSVAWTAMITGYVRNSRPRAALDVFDRMRDEGSEIDDVTLVGVISACASLGLSKHAKWVHRVAETSGFGPGENVFVGSAMVDMYSKCGDLDEAVKVFASMKNRNTFTYGSMISGYGAHGRAGEAMWLFCEMLGLGFKPNGTTFLALLGAFRNSGLTVPGKGLFASMEKIHGVVRGVEHYACLVDLLGRDGKLEEALTVIVTMPVEPNGPVWGALLAACRTHHNVKIAEVAANRLFELEPREAGNYTLLSSVYASAGMWDRVSRVRRSARERGVKKNPGYSWIEVRRGEIRTFVSGDEVSEEINRTLGELLGRMESRGYDEEEKIRLRSHSEKLALAFGLANSRPGEAIKIMKSLRMCEDCHGVMCGASRVTGREIVVRDSVRFHHFRDGSCSCGNYW